MRRRREYTSLAEAEAGIQGWKARSEAAIKRNAERDIKDSDIAVRRFIHERDAARKEYALTIEKRDALAARIAASASKLGVMRRNRSRGGDAPAAIVALIDMEKNAAVWLAEAEAAVDRARSALHDAQARHDAGMAAHDADLNATEELQAEPEAQTEPGSETPRGRGRPRKTAA